VLNKFPARRRKFPAVFAKIPCSGAKKFPAPATLRAYKLGDIKRLGIAVVFLTRKISLRAGNLAVRSAWLLRRPDGLPAALGTRIVGA
jgi:hypothetical protein